MFDKVMDQFYYQDDKISEQKARELLLPYVEEVYSLWLKYANDEDDWRSGKETYGFSNPLSTLRYISDRYYCAFRLKWIYDFITEAY